MVFILQLLPGNSCKMFEPHPTVGAKEVRNSLSSIARAIQHLDDKYKGESRQWFDYRDLV